MRTFINIGVSLEVLTFLISLITLTKYRHSNLRYLPIYFGVITCLELYCGFFYRVNNVWLFNILSVFEFNFLAYIFWKYFNRFNRRLLLVFLVVFNSVTIGNYIFKVQDFLVEPISQTYVMSSFMLIIMIILLFNQILRSNVRFEEIHRNILFWICMGFLIYLGIALPMQAITNWDQSIGEFRINLIYFHASAVYLKNILFIFGFIWGKKTFTY
ncbi:hypothetical protein [Moheibacter sediminis]|uniref:Uncharacterized protein n=1 Tax=Moheibacter sediminis TaxID=1434700 RepID=A0A1W2AIW0_9FLAO|nr:hypothetical protein [Moheibacter sediminis]SMC60554.1 hypothetical protein SAMN06296427_104205 [Moheibacter sediminis]